MDTYKEVIDMEFEVILIALSRYKSRLIIDCSQIIDFYVDYLSPGGVGKILRIQPISSFQSVGPQKSSDSHVRSKVMNPLTTILNFL